MFELTVSAIIILILSLIAFFQFRRINELSDRVRDLGVDPSNWTFHSINGDTLPAFEKANQLITTAETDALKITTEKAIEADLLSYELKTRLDRFIRASQDSIDTTVKDINQSLSVSVEEAKQGQKQFVLQLEKQSVTWQNQVEGEMKTKLNDLMFGFEQKIADFFSSAEQKSIDAINLEIRSARQLIDSYKSQQLSIIDENIIAVLEKTLSLVLNKRLSLENQMDLVYEALEKAKIEKFLT